MTVQRCEPTYKELKPLGKEKSRAIGLSCEPTYKELKHWQGAKRH